MTPKQKQEVTRAIQRVLAGDVDSYESIYNLTDRPLRAFIGSRYGYFGSDFVDEVAINTHEYSLTRLNKYDPDKGASFQTWLNWQSLNVARKVRVEWFGPRVVPVDADRLDLLVSSVPDPAETSEAARRSRVLSQEYERLTEDGRLSIGLHDLEGLTFADTAQQAGLSVGKVRRKREQTLAVLKRRLQERGVSATERDSTPVPVWYGWDNTGYDDDWTASVTAILPDGPAEPVAAAAEEEREVSEE